MNPADQLASLQALAAKLGPPRTPRHPEAGCPCTSCTIRDDRLEALAEDRAAARKGY